MDDEDNSQYSSFRAINKVALPAIVLNAAAPVTTACQVALLGHYASTDALAAFAAVSITAGFASRVFNFLVDGVSAKTGKSVGQRNWAELTARVQLALLWAVCAGVVASGALALLIQPVSIQVLHLSEAVRSEAAAYWWIRVALLPVLLVNMAISGILQGFRHVRASAIVNTCQSLVELLGSYLVLRYHPAGSATEGLAAMGCVTLATQVLATVGGMACVLRMPPPEAHGQYSLWDDWFGSGAAATDGKFELVGDAAVRMPLLFGVGGGGDSTDGSPSVSPGGSRGKLPSSPPTGSLSRAPLPSNSSRQQAWAPPATQPPGALAAAPSTESTLDFLRDGLNMFVRSMIMQATFFMALVAAARLGTDSLAAHSVVHQMWTLVSYGVDGFAAAGIVLGSRLAAQAHDPRRAASAREHLSRLNRRVLLAGLAAGSLAGLWMWLCADGVVSAFTDDPAVVAELGGGVWLVLVASQPLNGLLFVYDGLMYASQHFTFIRNYMLLGFVAIWCPALLLGERQWHALWAIWAAKAAFNAWRLGGAAFLIHHIFMREFDAGLAVQAAQAEP